MQPHSTLHLSQPTKVGFLVRQVSNKSLAPSSAPKSGRWAASSNQGNTEGKKVPPLHHQSPHGINPGDSMGYWAERNGRGLSQDKTPPPPCAVPLSQSAS